MSVMELQKQMRGVVEDLRVLGRKLEALTADLLVLQANLEAEQEFNDEQYRCVRCGTECPVAPRAVCEEHCPGHTYVYDSWERKRICQHCGKEMQADALEPDFD
jgi:uncharacterized protein with PIN domain